MDTNAGLGRSRAAAQAPPPARGSTRGSHGTYVVVVLYGLPREVQHSPWDYPLTEEVSNLEVGG